MSVRLVLRRRGRRDACCTEHRPLLLQLLFGRQHRSCLLRLLLLHSRNVLGCQRHSCRRRVRQQRRRRQLWLRLRQHRPVLLKLLLLLQHGQLVLQRKQLLVCCEPWPSLGPWVGRARTPS